MDKRRVSTIAAGILMAAMVIVTGCKPNQPVEPAPSVPPTTNPQGPNTGSSDVSTPSIEFSKGLSIGELTIAIANNMATVRFAKTGGVVYIGNGAIAADGAVEFALHEVNNTAVTIPFKGTYEKDKQRFILKTLTKGYPSQAVALWKTERGNTVNPQKSFVRYAENLEGSDGQKNIGAVFTITLDTEKVLITAVYGRGNVKKHFLTEEARLEGNEAHAELKIDNVAYTLRLVFNEDTRVDNEERTEWYLGKRNPKYQPNLKEDAPEYAEKGHEYNGGFYLYKKSEIKGYEGAMIPSSVTVSKVAHLYQNRSIDANDFLGRLEINIVGSVVTLDLTQTSNPLFVGEQIGAKHRRRMVLKPMGNGLYASEALGSASVIVDTLPANAAKKYQVQDAIDRVFTFVHTKEPDASGNTPKYAYHKYNTYDFKITEYNPVTGKFRLQGRCLLEQLATDTVVPNGALAGTKLFPSKGQPLYYTVSGASALVLDGQSYL